MRFPADFQAEIIAFHPTFHGSKMALFNTKLTIFPGRKPDVNGLDDERVLFFIKRRRKHPKSGINISSSTF